MNDDRPLLCVENLSLSIRREDGDQPVVHQLGFRLNRGRTFALVGASGSGKTLTALSILRLLPEGIRADGQVWFQGRNLLLGRESEMQQIRGRQISIIFQDPQAALNPVMSIGDQVGEVLLCHQRMRKAEARDRTIEMLHHVELPAPERHYGSFPHQLSGGMRQRVLLAMALICRPALLIADEPTTALDSTSRKRIMELLCRVQARLDLAILLITHDLPLVAGLADEVGILYRGRLADRLQGNGLRTEGTHPYTRRLFQVKPESRTPRRPRALTCPDRSVAPPILQVRGLRVSFQAGRRWFRPAGGAVPALAGVDLCIPRGRTLALVGESGCGKTTLGRALLGLVPAADGEVFFEGRNLLSMPARALRNLRPELQIVFQDPYSSLNPRRTIGDILQEAARVRAPGCSKAELKRRVAELLESVQLEAVAAGCYPHQLSGGQRQRAAIARALAVEPSFIVCDEVTSSLDAPVQSRILGLLRRLQRRRGLTYLLITHDFGVVGGMADRVAVMHQGRIVETGEIAQIFQRPRHPQTRRLLAAAGSPAIGARPRHGERWSDSG